LIGTAPFRGIEVIIMLTTTKSVPTAVAPWEDTDGVFTTGSMEAAMVGTTTTEEKVGIRATGTIVMEMEKGATTALMEAIMSPIETTSEGITTADEITTPTI
jgi:hypothetical protein